MNQKEQSTTPIKLSEVTNDNRRQPRKSIQTEQLLRMHQQPQFQQVAASESASHAIPLRAHPLARQSNFAARPVRPNLRRQVIVAASAHHLGQSMAIGDSSSGSLVMGEQLVGVSLPPKRPARLPAHYDANFAAAHPRLPSIPGATESAPAAATISSNSAPASALQSAAKPNRYSWAQMQQWQLAAAQLEEHGKHLHEQSAGQAHHHFGSPLFASAASRVLIVNPMHIVNLSEHTKSRLIKIIEGLKHFSEKWFSHVLLLMFLAVYACFGAYIFINFEAPTEQWEKQQIIETRARIINESWPEAHTRNREEFLDYFRGKFEDYERLLNRACQSGMSSTSLENQWTFWGALFYSMTVFTTIGYGHLTPVTFGGRVATMVYAIFGIPILLMVLADLGKLLTRIIKYAFKKFRHLYNRLLHRKSSLRTRKLISDNTNLYIHQARGAFQRGFATYIQPYNRIPQAFAMRASSLGRRSNPQTSAGHASETLEPAGAADSLERSAKDQTTDVIVTPARQTKPVSPQPGEKRSLATLAAAESRNSRSHSPPPNGGQPKRKISGGIKRANASKTSISRSPSNSQADKSNQQTSSTKQSASMSPSALDTIEGSKSYDTEDQQTVETKQLIEAGEVGKLSGAADETAPSAAAQAELDNEDQVELDAEEMDGTINEDLNVEEIVNGEEEDDDIHDEFDIPVSFALFLLVTYMMFGAVIFSIWEGWNFFDSLYFVFISMSTIGFGDLVPQHPKRMIGTFAYLLFGLALTSMCINVVQEKIHATFLRAKMQIGEKMGLDLDQIMADDYYDQGSTLCMEANSELDGDATSVAVSQTNTSSLASPCSPTSTQTVAAADAESGECGALEQRPIEPGSEQPIARLAKVGRGDSLKSLKSKRLATTGLPGHSNLGGSLRRKSSVRRQTSRQSTPTPSGQQSSGPAAPPAVAPPDNSAHQSAAQTSSSTTPQPPAQPQPQPIKALLEPAQPQNQPAGSLEIGGQPEASSAQQILCSGRPMVGVYESLGQKIPQKAKLVASRSQPTVDAARPLGEPEAPSPSDGRKYNPYSSSGLSAGSSRRSSVSQELNQLDDIIVALSRSPAERFGPLLGIPASACSSRSNSPANSLIGRRGTSMIDRPTVSQAGSPTPTAKKKSSLAVPPPSGSLNLVSATPANNRNSPAAGSKVKLDADELETIKFSAV